MKETLKPNGVLEIDSFGIFEGEESIVWKSIYKTLGRVSPEVRIFPVREG
jgi:hypothetical protein